MGEMKPIPGQKGMRGVLDFIGALIALLFFGAFVSMAAGAVGQGMIIIVKGASQVKWSVDCPVDKIFKKEKIQ